MSAFEFDTEQLAESLIVDEGFSGVPYQDTVGKWTIGYGRNLSDNPLTKAEAAMLLGADVGRAIADLDRRLPWWRNLDPVRQQVLANMAYNLGITKLCGFVNTLAAMKAGDYAKAAQGMIDSRWARQVGARAHRLARQMETGKA